MTKEILQAAFAAADAGKEVFEQFKAKTPGLLKEIRDYVIRMCLWFLASFLVTMPILGIGIFLESKTVIIFAGIIRAVAVVIFRITLAPLELTISFMKDGLSGSFQKYINSVSGLFIAELILIAVAAWLPLKNNPDMIIMFFLLASIIAVIGSQVFNRKAAMVITSSLLVLTTLSFFFPHTFASWGKGLSGGDETRGMPTRIDKTMTCGGFKSYTYKFFGDNKKPLNYYYVNQRTREIEIYVLNSKNDTHPVNGEQLKPITTDIVYALERQVCGPTVGQTVIKTPTPAPGPVKSASALPRVSPPKSQPYSAPKYNPPKAYQPPPAPTPPVQVMKPQVEPKPYLPPQPQQAEPPRKYATDNSTLSPAQNHDPDTKISEWAPEIEPEAKKPSFGSWGKAREKVRYKDE